MWNLVNIPSGIFIVDHACETMHNACKTGALMRKFAFRANKTTWWPTVPPPPPLHGPICWYWPWLFALCAQFGFFSFVYIKLFKLLLCFLREAIPKKVKNKTSTHPLCRTWDATLAP